MVFDNVSASLRQFIAFLSVSTYLDFEAIYIKLLLKSSYLVYNDDLKIYISGGLTMFLSCR